MFTSLQNPISFSVSSLPGPERFIDRKCMQTSIFSKAPPWKYTSVYFFIFSCTLLSFLLFRLKINCNHFPVLVYTWKFNCSIASIKHQSININSVLTHIHIQSTIIVWEYLFILNAIFNYVNAISSNEKIFNHMKYLKNLNAV
jgi:hypothetical protein